MNTQRIKAYIRLITCRIKEGKKIPVYHQEGITICGNCQTNFSGNYCLNCGQHKDVPRFSYKWIAKNMIGGWINIDSGFFFTIKELFIRPGYMINDYITGKRIRYFRPLQMLFVLGAVYVLLSQALYSSAESIISHDKENQELVLELGKINVGKWITENEFIQSVYKLLDSWFSSNRALGVIWMLPVSALAMKIAFRKGARKLNLNLVEYFLVRTYAACQIFIVSILLLPLSKDPEDSLPWWLYFIFSFWINLQLFNDKIKTTFFRTVLMYVYLILILILLALFLVSILVFILWIFN